MIEVTGLPTAWPSADLTSNKYRAYAPSGRRHNLRPKISETLCKKSGASQRRMIMQGETETGVPVVVGNMGMETGTRRRYVFRFDKEVLARMFTLRLAVFPGTRFAVHKTELLTAQGWDSIPERSVKIIPSHGYFDQSGGVILSYRGDQVVRFILSDPDSENPIMDGDVTGIAIEATITKLPIFLDPGLCGIVERFI